MSDSSEKGRELSDASECDSVPLLRFTTDDLPPEDRYRAWHLRDWPRTQPIYRTDPLDPRMWRGEGVAAGDARCRTKVDPAASFTLRID